MSIRRHGQLLSGALAADFQKSAIRGTSDPTASTAGDLTQGYVNTATGNAWFCSAIDDTDPQNVVYTWEQYIPTSEKGAAGGVAQLDANSKLSYSQMPVLMLDSAPTISTAGHLTQQAFVSATGKCYQCIGVDNTDPNAPVYTWAECINSAMVNVANGVAGLDGKAKISYEQIPPPVTTTKIGGVCNSANSGLSINAGGAMWLASPNNSQIDKRGLTDSSTRKALNIGNLDYAVRSVLPNITTIPADTTRYELLDSSATSRNHTHTYTHSPTAEPTYVLPAVTDTSVTHLIRLFVDFTAVQTLEFVDAQDAEIAPLFTPTISAGDIYEFRCEYSAMQSRWLIWPVKQGAVGDDYVMQSQVGAANGVAGLDSSGLVPGENLPKASNTTYGSIVGGAGLYIDPADKRAYIANIDNNDMITDRIGGYGITPSKLNYAVTAALTDSNKIQLTDAQKASAQDTLGVGAAPIIVATYPTTSTVGVVGQLYVNTSTGQVFVCKSISNTGTEEEPVYSYNWQGLLYAWNSVPSQSSRIVQGTHAIQFYTSDVRRLELNTNGILIGGATTNSIASMAIGNGSKTSNTDSLAVGLYSTVKVRYQTVLGQHNADASNCLFLVGNGTSASAKNNGLTSDISGNLYIYGGHQQAIHTIPSATTAYTFAEGTFSHIPASAPTYTLRTVSDSTRTHEVILTILFRGYYRSAADDSGSAYAWKSTDGTLLYTDTTSITEGTTVAYSDTALTESAGAIALYDSVKSAFSLVGSYSFEDADGNAIVPLSTPTIGVGSVVTFLCRWEALLGAWVIMPIPVGKEQVPA